MELPLKSRKAAGKALAQALQEYKDRDDVIVLGLPRSGVPVAGVGESLRAPCVCALTGAEEDGRFPIHG